MNREPNIGVRFQRYADAEFNYFEGVESCDRCGTKIEAGDTFVHIELWNKSLGYGEVSLCSVQCEQKYPLNVFTSRPTNINAISVSKRPKDSWIILPSPPEYGSSIDWTDANDWNSKLGGDVRYRGRYARDPDTMKMSLEDKRRVMIETRDADGLSIADFSDPSKSEAVDLSEEKTMSDLDLILNATPIDAHNQVDDDKKKRIGDDR